MVRSGLVIVGILSVLAVYGVAVEPRFILDKRTYEVELPDLSPGLAGTKLAVFSDLQVGAWGANLGMVERVVGEAVDEKPDAILILGDFLYGDSPDPDEQIEMVADLLGPLENSEIPVFAVLGNHDYEVGAEDRITDQLERMGIEVLSNTAATVEQDPSSALHIVGVGPHRPGRADIAEAFQAIRSDAARVVMMHNPLTFRDIPAGWAPLAFAGHTHCGQMVLPGMPDWSYLALRYPSEVVADGWAERSFGNAGNRLFVTCGVGFSDVPLRINAAPQLVVFELVPPG